MKISSRLLHKSTALRLRKNGFSLIELMVAMTIGLFITLGLSGMFLSMYNSSSTQRTLSQFQDNQRFAIIVLNNTLDLAGYFWNPAATLVSTALPATTVANPDGSTFAAGTGIVGTSTGTNDTFNVYYQTGGNTNDGVMNCQGQTAPTATTPITYINSFSIDANNNLVCAVTPGGGATSSALILANNVQSMRVLYGLVYTGPCGGTAINIPYVGSYLTASQVNAATTAANAAGCAGSQWYYVATAQVTLVFLNPATNTTSTWIQTFNLMH